MVYEEPRFLVGGDRAIFVEFGDAIAPEVNQCVSHLTHEIVKKKIIGITEVVPTYRSLLVYYEPRQISSQKLRKTLYALAKTPKETEVSGSRLIEIPTLYGGEFGPDIEFVAAHNSLSITDVIQIHSSNKYIVYMLGFIPGFPYLGGLSSRIRTPRLGAPRIKIPAGSVGVAGNQTGIYPMESPSGWQIIGRTPLKLFDPNQNPPTLLKAGDYLTFINISLDEFNMIKDQVGKGMYQVRKF